MSEADENENRGPKLSETVGVDDVDEESGFNKRDKIILDEYQKWRATPEDSREPAEVEELLGKLQEDTGFDKNHIKCVVDLGIYKGGRDEVNRRHGQGHAIYANGDEYQGEYSEGKRHGTGLYKYKSLGANPIDAKIDELWTLFKENNPNASSDDTQQFLQETASKLKVSKDMVTLTMEKGPYPFYEGQFHENQKHGENGVMRFKDLGIYMGHWSHDKREGVGGVYRYPNGDVFEGDWSNGLKHGQGTYTFTKQQTSYCGKWAAGGFCEGQWRMPDGTCFEGNFENNQPHDPNSLNQFTKLNTQQQGSFVKGQWTPTAPLQPLPKGSAPQLSV